MTEAHKISGQCHCGSVRFTVDFPEGIGRVIRCNCSLCSMKGATMALVPMDALTVTEGAGLLSTYRFHSNVAEHHFCSQCGVYTHHRRRADPTQFGVNVACLEGVSPYDFDAVEIVDGRQHPRDHGGGALRTIAIQRFERSE